MIQKFENLGFIFCHPVTKSCGRLKKSSFSNGNAQKMIKNGNSELERLQKNGYYNMMMNQYHGFLIY